MCQNDYLVNKVQASENWFQFSNTVTWDTIAQVAIIVAGFVFIGIQLRAQRRLQEKGLKDKIKYAAYEEFAGKFAKSFPNGVAASLNILIKEFYKAFEDSAKTSIYRPPALTHENIGYEINEANLNLNTLIATMDRYEIISKNMPIFRKVLSYKSTQLFEFSTKLIFKLAYYLPDTTEEVTKTWMRPTEKEMSEMKVLVSEYDKIASEIVYYLDDLNTELQNTLLGDSFDHKLPVREPGDPDVLVLTSTRPEMIEKAKEIAELDDVIRNSGGMIHEAIWDDARNNSRPSVNDSTAQQ